MIIKYSTFHINEFIKFLNIWYFQKIEKYKAYTRF